MNIKRFIIRIAKNFKFLPKETVLKLRYQYYNKNKLDLSNPVLFNEKIQWLKLYYHPSILTKLADKYHVRDYVKQKIGEQYLNELYGYYNSVDQIDFTKLPHQFALKGVHGSSTNLIVQDKESLNIKETKRILKKWMKHNQYKKVGYEWAYKNIKPAIVAEKYLENKEDGGLIDYKFYCFNGIPKFITAHSSVSGKHFFDLNWEKLPFSWRIDYKGSIKKPKNLNKMATLAEKLADKFPFVRVDFYSIEDKIIFGEMTFYPTDGRDPFYPLEYNEIVGNFMQLPKIPEGKKIITEY